MCICEQRHIQKHALPLLVSPVFPGRLCAAHHVLFESVVQQAVQKEVSTKTLEE